MRHVLIGLFIALFAFSLLSSHATPTPSCLSEIQEAVELMEKSEQGDKNAQFSLGLKYKIGKEGIPQNNIKAYEWYLKSAKQGHKRAQYNLGILYSTGEGTPKNYKKARKWFLKAAKQNHEKAQYALGELYRLGKGVSENNIKAYTWFYIADKNGNPKAPKAKEKLSKETNKKTEITPAQITEAQRRAKEWFEKYPN